MVVVGGYNSSNTTHLAALAESHGVRAYHIEDANCVDPVAAARSGTSRWARSRRSRWPAGSARAQRIGITAGASTPNNKVGETIARIAATAGLERELGVLLESSA